MDLPNHTRYGVKCYSCPAVFWSKDKFRIELMCTLSFADAREDLKQHEALGIVIGYSRFDHVCRPDLDD